MAQSIRAQRGPVVSLVAMTAWDWEIEKARAQQAGFDRPLRKPIDVDALARLLSELGAHKIPRSAPAM